MEMLRRVTMHFVRRHVHTHVCGRRIGGRILERQFRADAILRCYGEHLDFGPFVFERIHVVDRFDELDFVYAQYIQQRQRARERIMCSQRGRFFEKSS